MYFFLKAFVDIGRLGDCHILVPSPSHRCSRISITLAFVYSKSLPFHSFLPYFFFTLYSSRPFHSLAYLRFLSLPVRFLMLIMYFFRGPFTDFWSLSGDHIDVGGWHLCSFSIASLLKEATHQHLPRLHLQCRMVSFFILLPFLFLSSFPLRSSCFLPFLSFSLISSLLLLPLP